METQFKEEIEQLKQRLTKTKEASFSSTQDSILLKDMSSEIANIKANSTQQGFLELEDLNQQIESEVSMEV